MTSLLLTGGTGTFGHAVTPLLLADIRVCPEGVRQSALSRLAIFSRDEYKQSQMREAFPDPRLRFFLGDVRDRDRLIRAMHGIDSVIHAAALKQIGACEYNPFEAVKTNVLGAQNVIEAAVECGVRKVLALSTDKAVNPVNLYGATKLCAEKLFVQANGYLAGQGTRFACARYGNVDGSRGSVAECFRKQAELPGNTVILTDPTMTRFLWTAEEAAAFSLRCLDEMHGGEIFVPKLQAKTLAQIKAEVAPEARMVEIGRRPGEKRHEVLISPDEMGVKDIGWAFVVEPQEPTWAYQAWEGERRPQGFPYSSATALQTEVNYTPAGAII